MPKQPKTRKAGRPPLPKGAVKDAYLRIRVTTDELREIEASARSENQSVSQWIRSKLHVAP